MTGMFAKAVEIDAENKNTLQDLHKYVKSGNVTLRTFNNSIFAECDKVVNDSIVFLKNCDNIDKKLKAFQDLKYLSKNKIEFIPTSINSLLIPPPKGRRKLLLGVFTYYSDGSTLRRTLLRFFYNSLFNVSSRNADLRFVMGIPQSEAQKRLILEEQSIFGDILLIDTPEAMNDGKSYYYIQQTIGMMDNGTFPTYEFIAKVDDDTLPNIRGIMKKIAEYDYQKDIYFGRAFVNNVENFGLLYGFSQELARKLANLNPKKGDVKSYEDYMMGLLVKKVSNTTRTIWDMIDTKYESGHFGWSIPLSKEILAVHTLKTSTEFWNYLMLYESIVSSIFL
ncbi:hypothetical protein HDU79_005726 [Rhizoclosmatium sp. JEL0117]|nr:hypothetical protein HDU79_005726 [Rhizoclosmatium sp. JEL0117]